MASDENKVCRVNFGGIDLGMGMVTMHFLGRSAPILTERSSKKKLFREVEELRKELSETQAKLANADMAHRLSEDTLRRTREFHHEKEIKHDQEMERQRKIHNDILAQKLHLITEMGKEIACRPVERKVEL